MLTTVGWAEACDWGLSTVVDLRCVHEVGDREGDPVVDKGSHANLVRETLQAIANAEAGVLIHCSAGRDRTGMISALLLGNAGVSPDDVADEYAQSVRAMAGATTHAPTHDRHASWPAAQVEQWIAETTSIVRETDSSPDVAFDAIGLPQEERIRPRELLADA